MALLQQYQCKRRIYARRRLEGTLLGLTAKLSLVNGTAFITSPSVDLRPYIGYKITLNDGTQNLVGYIKAAGTGETLGDEIIDTWINAGYDTLTLSGSDIQSAIEASSDNVMARKDSGQSMGNLLKFSVTTFTKTSGSTPYIILGSLGNLPLNTDSSVYYLAASGSNTTYYTQHSAIGTFVGFRNNAGVANWSAIGNSLKQVLTPSATGVTIVSAQGGTTYNWVSDGGINPNATSFTATITEG